MTNVLWMRQLLGGSPSIYGVSSVPTGAKPDFLVHPPYASSSLLLEPPPAGLHRVTVAVRGVAILPAPKKKPKHSQPQKWSLGSFWYRKCLQNPHKVSLNKKTNLKEGASELRTWLHVGGCSFRFHWEGNRFELMLLAKPHTDKPSVLQGCQ